MKRLLFASCNFLPCLGLRLGDFTGEKQVRKVEGILQVAPLKKLFKSSLPPWEMLVFVFFFPYLTTLNYIETLRSGGLPPFLVSWWVPCDCFGLCATGENHPCRKRAEKKKSSSSSSTPTTLKKRRRATWKRYEHFSAPPLEKWANGFLMTSAPRVRALLPYFFFVFLLVKFSFFFFFGFNILNFYYVESEISFFLLPFLVWLILFLLLRSYFWSHSWWAAVCKSTIVQITRVLRVRSLSEMSSLWSFSLLLAHLKC